MYESSYIDEDPINYNISRCYALNRRPKGQARKDKINYNLEQGSPENG